MHELQFCANLSRLRREKGVSQRKAASDLHISQALLSHYETGAREPGLAFVCRACDEAGARLGPETIRQLAAQLRQIADQAESCI